MPRILMEDDCEIGIELRKMEKNDKRKSEKEKPVNCDKHQRLKEV